MLTIRPYNNQCLESWHPYRGYRYYVKPDGYTGWCIRILDPNGNLRRCPEEETNYTKAVELGRRLVDEHIASKGD